MHAHDIHTQTDPFTQRGIYSGNSGRRDWLHNITFTHSYIDLTECLCLPLSRSHSLLSFFVCLLLSVSYFFYSGVFFSPSFFYNFFLNDLTHTHGTHHHLFCKKIGINSQQQSKKCPSEYKMRERESIKLEFACH